MKSLSGNDAAYVKQITVGVAWFEATCHRLARGFKIEIDAIEWAPRSRFDGSCPDPWPVHVHLYGEIIRLKIDPDRLADCASDPHARAGLERVLMRELRSFVSTQVI